MGGDAGAGGSAGMGGDAGAGGVGGNVVRGNCSNPTDIAELASLQPSNARTFAASVALGQCANDFDKVSFTACVASAIQETLTSLSTECATCYGELAWCSIPNCNVACQTDSCFPICLTCNGYDACREALNLCTGTLPQDCTGT